MEEFRTKIDQIDEKIMTSLIDRYIIVKEIGEHKIKNNIPIYDKNRENKIYEKIEDYYLLDEHRVFLKNIYKKLMEETKLVQKTIAEYE